MISIQPQWVEKILNGEKTIEIRKTMPKCELPCKVYIYCTQAKNVKENIWKVIDPLNQVKPFYSFDKFGSHKDVALNGKVVAEFTLNDVYKIGLADTWAKYGAWLLDEKRYLEDWEIEQILSGSRLSFDDMTDYLGYGDYETQQFANGYCWHIDNLKIYDKPKELSEFSHYIPNNKCPKMEGGIDCEDCMSYDSEHETCLALYYAHREIKRPPQSWCYVEELE